MPESATSEAPSVLKQWRDMKSRYRDDRNRQKNDPSRSRQIYSWLAMPVLQAALRAHLSADQLTAVGVAVGAGGCVLAAVGTWPCVIAAALCFQLFIIIDFADGALARVRQTASIRGWFMDIASGDVIGVSLFISMGFGVFGRTGWPGWILLGWLGTLGYFMNRHLYNVKILSALVGKKQEVAEALLGGEINETSKDRDVEGSRRREIDDPSTARPHDVSTPPPHDVTTSRPYDRTTHDARRTKSWLSRVDFLWNARYIINFFAIAALLNQVWVLVLFYGVGYPVIAWRTFQREWKGDHDWVYGWVRRISQ